MPLTIALYGDSYVSRLKNFCDAELRVPANVCWFEKVGARSDFLDKKGKFDVAAKANYDRVKTLRPDDSSMTYMLYSMVLPSLHFVRCMAVILEYISMTLAM